MSNATSCQNALRSVFYIFVSDGKPTTRPTWDEVLKFLEFILSVYPKLYPVFVIALNTGMRRGEIQALKWDCVDLNRKVVLVKRIYCRIEKRVIDRTKGKKDRIVPIPNPKFVSQPNS